MLPSRANEKLFTDNVSVQRYEGHSIATAKDSRRRRGHQSLPHKDTPRRLIYDRNDRTDSCKLRVVSHNLVCDLSPSTSRSAIVVSLRFVRMPIFIKQRVCMCMYATKSRSREKIATLNKYSSNFVRSKIHISPLISTMRELSLSLSLFLLYDYYYSKICTNAVPKKQKN